MGITGSTYPVLFVLGTIPAFGLLVLSSIIRLILSNKRLSTSGIVTDAEIIDKYRRGSTNYYKRDDGISYFVIVEWLIEDHKTRKHMLCRCKFMVNEAEFNSFETEAFCPLIYLPDDYQNQHNLECLAAHTVKTKTVVKRVSIGLMLIFLVPIIVGIVSEQWQLFVFPVLLGAAYFLIGSIAFKYLCRHKGWFNSTAFESRFAGSDDVQRFQRAQNDDHTESRAPSMMKEANDSVPVDSKTKDDDKKVSLLNNGLDPM